MFSWHDEHFSVHWFGLAVLAHRISRMARMTRGFARHPWRNGANAFLSA
jgi:hypothetical protein